MELIWRSLSGLCAEISASENQAAEATPQTAKLPVPVLGAKRKIDAVHTTTNQAQTEADNALQMPKKVIKLSSEGRTAEAEGGGGGKGNAQPSSKQKMVKSEGSASETKQDPRVKQLVAIEKYISVLRCTLEAAAAGCDREPVFGTSTAFSEGKIKIDLGLRHLEIPQPERPFNRPRHLLYVDVCAARFPIHCGVAD